MTGKTVNQDKKPLVLVVDDIPGNLRIMAQVLREADYNISLADSGLKALEMVKACRPHMILLEKVMPEMDGIQVCKILKASPGTRGIPVIFLTIESDTQSILEGFRAGAVDYITKPFNKEELLARVDTHLQLKENQYKTVKLEQRNAVQAMTVTASHELNQPLTVLGGNFELFQQTFARVPLDHTQQKYLTRMKSSIKNLQELMDKFSHSGSIHLEDYVGTKKMVVFDE
ncbi:MAG: response regulator [bacterium]|nr:response regulator [bacterium]